MRLPLGELYNVSYLGNIMDVSGREWRRKSPKRAIREGSRLPIEMSNMEQNGVDKEGIPADSSIITFST